MNPNFFNITMFMVLGFFILPNLLGAIYNAIEDNQ
jgi:hypothetical protein